VGGDEGSGSTVCGAHFALRRRQVSHLLARLLLDQLSAFKPRSGSLAQRYAEVRKGMDLKLFAVRRIPFLRCWIAKVDR
jgi:hypothetical protein